MIANENVSSQAASGIEGISNSDWPSDFDDLLTSLSPAKSAGDNKSKGQSKVSRFRVKWQADLIAKDRSAHHGFINDISTLGASIYLNSNLYPERPTLHIYVPPLSSTFKPHVIEVAGRTVYVVYDGEMQLYRVAVNFLRFNLESDREFLENRLTKYQLKIPDLTIMS